MQRISFKTTLWSTVFFVWLSLIALSVTNAIQTRELMMRDREAALREQVQSALSIVNAYRAAAQAGTLSTPEAKRRALAQLRVVRYGTNGYLLVVDSSMLQLLNPVRPELENRINDLIDETGKHFTAEIVRHGIDGTHITTYRFPKPGQTRAEPKIAYGDYLKDWDWHVYTGAYVDDIDSAFYARLVRELAVVCAVGLALTFVMSGIIRRVLGALGGDPQTVARLCERIAQGDLTVPVTPRDGDTHSLVASVRTMQERLSAAIDAVKRSADSIVGATDEIAAGNADLSARTEAQAAALEQTAASMEQLTSTVQQNSTNAETASGFAARAHEVALECSDIVSRVVNSMSDIDRSAARIGEIIGMIESIAFQTNILALNAAVEAARAGEQGRGFSVVASEVRALAQRSSAAAKDVRAMIGSSASSVREGNDAVVLAGDAMQRVRGAIARVAELMGEIAAASQEQSRGIDQVNQAVTQMDENTQQNAALVEEASAAAHCLRGQAHDLMASVAAFRTA
ncbi:MULTISPECIES: methyl-accepting chemotaxis protein [unclassified Paraburkholderia]|uniref:methyl-accepting chemotaxis protein n=1 Tax=unclassified Paraburkholderia TaxID=2615204 RepID=UPI002AB25584|nr:MULTISPECIES: methyl-accepting chemotaxis protein [unclassified Paraburkholderia]